MPTDLESLLIYAIVLLTLGWMLRSFIRGRRTPRPGCGKDCGCEVHRDPAIQKFLDRRGD